MLHSQVLEAINLEFPDHSAFVTVPTWGSLTPETRSQFRASLARNLFGWDVLLSLRMRLSVADFAWVSPILTGNDYQLTFRMHRNSLRMK